jgi:predicted nuclease of predicted toxin-antitoxin system
VRLLIDACVWGGCVKELAGTGHDVVWAGDWPHDPGDEEILTQAHREGRIVVTLDKDFGELAVVHGIPHAGIIRLVRIATRQQGRICRYLLEHHAADLVPGTIITVEPGRLRIRRP